MMQELIVGIGGMSCQGCVKNVSGVLLAVPGVESVEVSLAEGQASIVYDPAEVDVAQFKAAIEGAGFDVGVLRHVDKTAGQRPVAGKGFVGRGRALHQQHLQFVVQQAEDRHVHRGQRAREVGARRVTPSCHHR